MQISRVTVWGPGTRETGRPVREVPRPELVLPQRGSPNVEPPTIMRSVGPLRASTGQWRRTGLEDYFRIGEQSKLHLASRGLNQIPEDDQVPSQKDDGDSGWPSRAIPFSRQIRAILLGSWNSCNLRLSRTMAPMRQCDRTHKGLSQLWLMLGTRNHRSLQRQTLHQD